MDAVVFYPHSVLHLPFFSALTKSKLGRPFFPLKEIAVGPSLFAYQGDHLQLTALSIRTDENRRGGPPRKNAAMGRSPKGDGNKMPHSSDDELSNSSNQEEIIALFRRIQSSISKGESTSSKKKSLKLSEEKPSAESVLEVLHQSRKQVKEKTSNKGGTKVLTRRRDQVKKEEIIDYPSVDGFKLSRPPSNFVKRSPIPSPPNPRGKVELKSGASSATAGVDEVGLEEVEKMKLPALKELAKSRGIKGYSKLKKSELVELLRS